jgi:hypothetical protein
MRKVLPVIILSFFFNQNSYSDEIEDKKSFKFKMEGEVKTIYGFSNQKPDFLHSIDDDNKLKNDSPINKNSFSTSGKLKIYADYLNKESFGYGAYIKFNANPSKTSEISNEMKVYLQDKFGKFELGATGSATGELSVNAYDLARATGGLDGDSYDWIKAGFVHNNKVVNNAFITSPKLTTSRDNNSKANKLNFFSPKINGFTFGVSFVPDTASKGAIDATKNISKTSSDNSYKNVVQPGVRYEGKINENISFATAVVSEFGKAKDFLSGTDKTPRNNLAAWQVGAMLKIQDVSFAASYGNQGKSGTAKETDAGAKKLGNYWSVGSAFAKEKYGVSINYMQSKRAGYMFNDDNRIVDKSKNSTEVNKFSALVIGADYMIMDGLMPFVEYTKFKFHKNNNFGGDAKFNNGHIFLVGTKLQF